MSGSLAGRTALVTGAARNIGRAIVLALAAEGAAVVVNAQSSAAEAQALAAEVNAAGGRALARLADVTDQAAVAGLMTETVAFGGGGLDILVNNAAIRRETPFERLDYAEWRQVLAVILDGAFLCTRAALPHLRPGGSVVNIGGLSAHTGSPGRAHVVAAKAGLAGLTRALAHDLSPRELTVNCVVPGVIDTVRGASTGGTPAMHGHHKPLTGRRGRPDEVAALVCFLCGPDARFLTGQTLHANGGAFLNN